MSGSETARTKYGDVAQLGERSVRNAEVAGSNPVVSTSIQRELFI